MRSRLARTNLLQLLRLLEGLQVARLCELGRQVVQLDNGLRDDVAGTRVAARVARDNGGEEVVCEPRQDGKGPAVAREVLLCLDVCGDTRALANPRAGELGPEAVRVLRELNDEVRVEVNAGRGAPVCGASRIVRAQASLVSIRRNRRGSAPRKGAPLCETHGKL
jgi:hypothetical protein